MKAVVFAFFSFTVISIFWGLRCNQLDYDTLTDCDQLFFCHSTTLPSSTTSRGDHAHVKCVHHGQQWLGRGRKRETPTHKNRPFHFLLFFCFGPIQDVSSNLAMNLKFYQVLQTLKSFLCIQLIEKLFILLFIL